MLGDIGRFTPRPEPFLRQLVAEFRAQDPERAIDGRADWDLLRPLIVSSAGQRASGREPDPDVFLRIELFYAAVGRVVGQRAGVSCSLMLKMHHEGFGHVVLLAGRLVALSHQLRNVERFGFDSLEHLAEAGERLVAEAIEMIERFPEVARQR